MRFKVQFPEAQVKARLQAIGRDIVTERRNLLQAVGTSLLSQSQQAYRVKSRGGTGSDGIAWKPLAASTIEKRNRRGKRNAKRTTTRSGKARPAGGSVSIGIDTGLQLSSASPGFKDNIFDIQTSSVTVGYGRSYSKYFDEQRPLMPNRLPPKWRELCDNIVFRWLRNIFTKRLSD